MNSWNSSSDSPGRLRFRQRSSGSFGGGEAAEESEQT